MGSSSLSSSPLSSPPSSPPARLEVDPPQPDTSSPAPSRHLRSPTPQGLKPRLEDFSYRSIPFPAQPPQITPRSSPLDLTISLVAQILESRNNDVALAYMLDHHVVQRLFSPRRVCKGTEGEQADFALRRQYSASAMAWYLLDPGTDLGKCSACLNEQSQGPFEECIVPTERRAEGACTNCFFKGRSAMCPHRIARYGFQSRKRGPTFDGFREDDLEEATEQELKIWGGCMRGELSLRSADLALSTSRRRRRRLAG